jgi:hypothetical protein
VKEVHSQEELQTLIANSAQADRIRIWVFNSSEWISYDSFKKRPLTDLKSKNNSIPEKQNGISANRRLSSSSAKLNGKQWLRKFLLFSISGAAIFLVYNFTKLKWQKAEPLSIAAARPENTPFLDADSVINVLELQRGLKLDKTTRTNLRIRNTWPERILLQLNTERETNNEMTRYTGLQFILDNTTGYELDNAVVKVTVWTKNQISKTDTFHFDKVGYAQPLKRTIGNIYKGDSLSVSFQSLKASSFNFCYTAGRKSNYGSSNDRWYCRD